MIRCFITSAVILLFGSCAQMKHAGTQVGSLFAGPIVQGFSSLMNAGKSNFQYYGNWCGPNHPSSTDEEKPPIDYLDSLCMEHDKCYEERGLNDCYCDVNLVKSLHDWRDIPESLQVTADGIAGYFASSSCDGCKATTYGGFTTSWCSSTYKKYGCRQQNVERGRVFYYCPKDPLPVAECKLNGGVEVDLQPDRWAKLTRKKPGVSMTRIGNIGCLYIYPSNNGSKKADKYCFDGNGRFGIGESVWLSSEKPGGICVGSFRFEKYENKISE